MEKRQASFESARIVARGKGRRGNFALWRKGRAIRRVSNYGMRLVLLFSLFLITSSRADWNENWHRSWREWGPTSDYYTCEQILQAPWLNFETALRMMPVAKEFANDPLALETLCWRIQVNDLDREVEELRGVLQAAGHPKDKIELALWVYREMRRDLQRQKIPGVDVLPHQIVGDHMSSYLRRYVNVDGPGLGDPGEDVTEEIPSLIPEEFRLYSEGATVYWTGDFEGARATFRKLLELPKEERRYRTVWATWMMGKTEADPEKALPWFRQTSELGRSDDFEDLLGLAQLAEGWLAEDDDGSPKAYFLDYRRMVEGHTRGLIALHHLCNRIAWKWKDDPDVYKPLLEDSYARQSHIANGGFYTTTLFLTELYDKKVELSPAERGILAVHLYDSNHFLAEDAAKNAPDHYLGRWVLAKLAFRDGNYWGALQRMEALKGHFQARSPQEPPWDLVSRELQPMAGWWGTDIILFLQRRQFWQDLGEMRLQAGEFEGAYSAFLEAGRPFRAAYVAHNLLSADALLSYTKKHFPEAAEVEITDKNWGYYGYYGIPWQSESQLANFARHTAARLLMNEGRFDEAIELFCPEMKEIPQWYADEIAIAEDESRPDAERADAYWLAAQIRIQYPAWFALQFPSESRVPPDLWTQYWQLMAPWPACMGEPDRAQNTGAVPQSGAEQNLIRQSGRITECLGWPRFDAAQLAWKAAELMPDDDSETAHRLCYAGTWLKYDSPQKADRFYKALVRRCPTQELAYQAATIRWFPVSLWQAMPREDDRFMGQLQARGIKIQP